MLGLKSSQFNQRLSSKTLSIKQPAAATGGDRRRQEEKRGDRRRKEETGGDRRRKEETGGDGRRHEGDMQEET